MTGWPNTFLTHSDALPLRASATPLASTSQPSNPPPLSPPIHDRFQRGHHNPNPHVYSPPGYNWLQRLLTFNWVDNTVSKAQKPLIKRQYLHNPQALQPVQSVINRLLHTNGITDRYTAVLVNDPAYNAFVTEDGLVYLNEGFLKKVKNPTELAFVLAHELSHVISKDASKTDTIAKQLGYATKSVLAAGLLLLGFKQQWPVKQWATALGKGIGQLFDKTLYTQALPTTVKHLLTLFKQPKALFAACTVGLKNILKAPFFKALALAAVLYGAIKFVSQLILDKAVCRREDEADLRAISMLRNAGIETTGIEAFQQSLIAAEKESKWQRKLWKKISRDHTHPNKRMQLVSSALQNSQGFGPAQPQPALTPAQWQHLQMALKPRLAQLAPLPPIPTIGRSALPAGTKPQSSKIPPVKTTLSGLQYTDTVVGTGATATQGHSVTVHYTGTLHPNGKQFDSSLDRGEPFTFVLGKGQVIKGWDEGVAGMKVGGKRTLIIPAKLGYGADGAGSDIPPNATLTFDIELLGTQ